MTYNLDFSAITEVVIPVKWQGKDYLLHEMSEGAHCEHRNFIFRATGVTVNESGDVKSGAITNLADMEPLIISMCLYDSDGKLVPEATIRSWPKRVVEPIWDCLAKISGLTSKEAALTEKAKNSPSATPATSA